MWISPESVDFTEKIVVFALRISLWISRNFIHIPFYRYFISL